MCPHGFVSLPRAILEFHFDLSAFPLHLKGILILLSRIQVGWAVPLMVHSLRSLCLFQSVPGNTPGGAFQGPRPFAGTDEPPVSDSGEDMFSSDCNWRELDPWKLNSTLWTGYGSKWLDLWKNGWFHNKHDRLCGSMGIPVTWPSTLASESSSSNLEPAMIWFRRCIDSLTTTNGACRERNLQRCWFTISNLPLVLHPIDHSRKLPMLQRQSIPMSWRIFQCQTLRPSAPSAWSLHAKTTGGDPSGHSCRKHTVEGAPPSHETA